MKRLTFMVAATVAMLTVAATPAFADPAVPTHFRSVIDRIEGTVPPSFHVEILGGDAFVVVRAGGAEVEIPGYEGEPYARIGPWGLVEINERSPARWLNDARYGARDVVVPVSVDPQAPPHWVEVASDGVWAWHDHRVHYMAPSLPRNVDPSMPDVQEVFAWQIPLVVDGTDVTIHGRLTWSPGPAVPEIAGWLLAILAVGCAGAWMLGRRRPSLAGVRWATLSAGLVAVAMSTGRLVGLPAGADGDPRGLVLAVAGLIVVVGLWATRRLERSPALFAVSLVPLIAWLGLWAPVMVRPIVPNVLPVAVVRTGFSVTAALLVMAAAILARTVAAGETAAGKRGPDLRER